MMHKCYFHFYSFINTLIWLLRQLKYENFHNYIPNKFQERSVIVLANGPSLNEAISFISEVNTAYDFCAVNDFCQSSYFKKIKPLHYILADPMYFNLSWQREFEKKTIDNFQSVSWKMNLYIPFNVWKSDVVKNIKQNPYITIIPFHTNEYKGWDFLRQKLFVKGLTMPKAQNVLIPTIFNLINSGYSKILLYGVDHSWTQDIRVNENNQVCLANKHFYDENAPLSPWLKSEGSPYKMHEILRDLAFMFEGYYALKLYASKRNCKIINMTKNSFIDAFERR